MIQEEKRAKTRIEVLEVVKEFLVKGAVRIEVKQLTNEVWKIVGYGN